MPYCDVCRGEKTIRVACWPAMEASPVEDYDTAVSTQSVPSKEFPCPQCSMVPFKRVRAMKVTTAYPVETFAKMQVPIERGLAARFGEYLMREGLIRFTQTGSKDFGMMENKITVTAHLGVVGRKDVERAGAAEEVAMTGAPALPERLKQQLKLGPKARRWQPNNAKPEVEITFVEEVTDEFDEPKDALGSRFAGLDLG